MSLRSKLGKAAALGGRAYVWRYVISDDFASIFAVGLDPPTRREVLALVAKLVASAPPVPTRKAITEQGRVKIHWDDTMIARFTAEASRSRDNKAVIKALGLPACCEPAVRRARARYLDATAATFDPRYSPGDFSFTPRRRGKEASLRLAA
jgi:hypothetical protein